MVSAPRQTRNTRMNGGPQQILVKSLNRLFGPRNQCFEAMMRSSDEAFEYSVRAGQVVHDQFKGANNFTDKVVLDYGCGAGGKTVFYAGQGPKRTIGVDRRLNTGQAAEYARRNGLQVEFHELRPDGAIPLRPDVCDVIINSSVLEHVEDLDAVFREMRRVLKPGGLLLNRWHPFRSRHGAHLGAAIGVPFAHLLFSEKTLVRAYYDGVMRRFGRIPPVLGAVNARSRNFDDLAYHLNRATVASMRQAVESAGFELRQRRHFRGTKEVFVTKLLPEALIDFVIDYELQICVTLSRARAYRRRATFDMPAATAPCASKTGELVNASSANSAM